MRFYEIDMSHDYDKYDRRYDASSDWEPKCRVCGISPGIRRPPVRLLIKGTPLPDVISLAPQELVVKNRVKEAVEAAGFTGIQYLQPQVEIATDKYVEGKWELYLVEEKKSRLYYIPPEEIQTGAPLEGLPLWHLVVTGQARLQPQNNCVPVQECHACGRAVYSTWDGGLLVDEGQWDGSDFFRLVEHGGFVVVTEQVKDLFELHRFTGVQFVPLDEKVDKFARFRPPRRTE
jgi:hypothetical protein